MSSSETCPRYTTSTTSTMMPLFPFLPDPFPVRIKYVSHTLLTAAFCLFSHLLQNFPAQSGKLPGSTRESGILFPRQGGWLIFTYKADLKANVAPDLLHPATSQLCQWSKVLLIHNTNSEAESVGVWPAADRGEQQS